MVNNFKCDYNNVHPEIRNVVSNFYRTYGGNGWEYYRWNGNIIASHVTHAVNEVFKHTCTAIESGRIPTEPLEVCVDIAFSGMICEAIKRIWNFSVQETRKGKVYCTTSWHDGPEDHKACSFMVNFNELPVRPFFAPYVPSKTNFASLQGDKDFTDFTLQFDEKKFACHKIVLATRSPVLKDFLAKGTPINMPKVTAEALKNFLDFLYTDQLTLSGHSLAQVADLLHLAKHFQVEGLAHCCAHELSTRLTDDTVEQIEEIAVQSGYKNLYDLCYWHRNSPLKKLIPLGPIHIREVEKNLTKTT